MVVIRDMEMPKSCANCKLTYADICPLLNRSIHKEVINEYKHKDCPLIEIRCATCHFYMQNQEINGTAPCFLLDLETVDCDDYCSGWKEKEK